MEIFVYKGLYNLASIDFECLRIISYIRIIQAPVNIVYDGNPFKSPNGCLPYLKSDNTKIAGFDKIVEHLRDKGYNTSQKNDMSLAYTSFLYDQLHPYLQYFLWGDQTNCDDTRILYAKRMIFPFSYYYPQKYAKNVDELMISLENFSLNDKFENHDVTNIIVRAKKCINVMNEKIGSKLYLLNGPSEIDATLYAYLSILYYNPMVNNPIKMHIQECPNLTKYVEMFGKKYLSPEIKKFENEKINKISKDPFNYESTDFSTKYLPKIVSAIVVVCAMTTFAIKNGFNIVLSNDKYDVNSFDSDHDDEDTFEES